MGEKLNQSPGELDSQNDEADKWQALVDAQNEYPDIPEVNKSPDFNFDDWLKAFEADKSTFVAFEPSEAQANEYAFIEKVKAAIQEWNRLPEDLRIKYLETGEGDFDPQLIETLSTALFFGEQPKMTLPNQLIETEESTADTLTLDYLKWANAFYGRDTTLKDGQNAQKERLFAERVGKAIDDWNNTPLSERQKFLRTGNGNIEPETISILTAARVIDLEWNIKSHKIPEKPPVDKTEKPTVVIERTRPPYRDNISIDNTISTSGTPIGFTPKPRAPREKTPRNKREPINFHFPDIPALIADGWHNLRGRIPALFSRRNKAEQTPNKNTHAPEEDKPAPIIPIAEVSAAKTPDNGNVLNTPNTPPFATATPDLPPFAPVASNTPDTPPLAPTAPTSVIQPTGEPTPKQEPTGSIPKNTPEGDIPKDIPKDIPVSEIPKNIPEGAPGDVPKSSPDDEPKNIDDKEKPKDPAEPILFTPMRVEHGPKLPQDADGNLAELVKFVPLALLIAMILKNNPFNAEHIPSTAEGQVSYEHEVPATTVTYERILKDLAITIEPGQEGYEQLAMKALMELPLGSVINVKDGLVYYASPDPEHGGDNAHGTTHDGSGEQTLVDRLQYIPRDSSESWSLGNPTLYNGNAQTSALDFLAGHPEINTTATDIVYHLDKAAGVEGGDPTNAQGLGWIKAADLAKYANFGPLETTITVPSMRRIEEPTTTTVQGTAEFTTGEEQNYEAAITTPDGEITLNLLRPDGEIAKQGDTLVGSDGKEYQILSIDAQPGDNQFHVDLVLLALDTAAIFLTAAYLKALGDVSGIKH